MESFKVLAGKGEVTAAYMPDSTLQATIPELRERLDRDGYLLIRHFLSVADVQKVSIDSGKICAVQYEPTALTRSCANAG